MMLGIKDYLQKDRTQWMQNWPGQVVLNGSQVWGATGIRPSDVGKIPAQLPMVKGYEMNAQCAVFCVRRLNCPIRRMAP